MSYTNVTLDDTETTYIQYLGGWMTIHTDDNMVASYLNGTFYSSDTSGDNATVRWQGTGFGFYGAHRWNHGDYSVAVDGGDKMYFSGYAEYGSGQFQIPLYADFDMEDGEHYAILTNEAARNAGQSTNGVPNDWMDLDFVIIQGTPLDTAGDVVSAASAPSTSTLQPDPTTEAESTFSTTTATAEQSADSGGGEGITTSTSTVLEGGTSGPYTKSPEATLSSIYVLGSGAAHIDRQCSSLLLLLLIFWIYRVRIW